MTKNEAVKYFNKTYPGKAVVQLPHERPTEIICEIAPTSEHPEHSTAIAAITTSAPHYHKHAAETYRILQGVLTLTVDSKEIKLREGETHTIQPGQTHSAKGNFTLVEVTSQPGWTAEDHILV